MFKGVVCEDLVIPNRVFVCEDGGVRFFEVV